MPQSQWIDLAVAFGLSVIASLLVAAETAFSQMSRARAEKLVEQGHRTANRVRLIAQDPAPTLGTAAFLRIICQTVAILLVGQVVYAHFSHSWERLLLAGGVMVLVSFIAWSVAPRTLGRQKAEPIALGAAGPMTALVTLLGPVSALLILIGNAITPGRGFADGPFSSEAELRELVDQAEASDVIESDERRMIHSVFDLGDTIVKEVMVPRTDIVYIERGKTLRQAMSLALRSGFSRIPVVDDGLDDVRGVLYLKDVVRRVFDNPDSERHQTVEKLMRPCSFTPDSKPVDELLREMQKNRNHIVLVVDEFGGTAGLATIEDILEEIVGEIVDEYDAEPTLTQQVEPGLFRVSARLPVDELGELFGLDVDDEDVETVGGLMAKLLNLVPIPGSAVEWEGLHLEAEKSVGRRHQIDTVLVRRVQDDEPPGHPSDRVTRPEAVETRRDDPAPTGQVAGTLAGGSAGAPGVGVGAGVRTDDRGDADHE